MANRNKAYWARRAKRTQDELQDRIYEEYVAAAEEAYTDAIHMAEEKLRAWVQRLANNNEISYAEAQKLLAKNELEEFHWSVQQYIKHGTDNLDGQWSKQLENASARVHISRYDAMKFELQALAKEATGKTIGTIKDAAALAYTESYNHTAFDLQQQVGVGVSMQGVDSRKLEHVLNRPWSDDGKTFSARCWEGCDNLVSKVNRELFRMVATGEKPDRAIAAIADEFGKTKRTAGRLVMTESAAIASQAQHDCYTELGVEEFEVIGTFDAHMCDFCGEMNGKHFPESKRKIGENAPPFHPWCRCTTAPWFEDMQGIGERWMRDPETGKGSYVPSDMTYQEWKAKYVDDKMSAPENILPIQEKTPHTAEEYAEIVRYAEDRGMKVFQVERFDGDTSVLYDQIDALHEIRQEYRLTKKLTIGFADMLNGDLARTSRDGSSVVFDRNALRHRIATNKFLSADNYLATNEVRGIGYHEAGHLIAKQYGEKGFDIAEKMYYNANGRTLTIGEVLESLESDLSQYSVEISVNKEDMPFKRKYYKEIIPEMVSRFKTEPTELTKSFILLLKEAYGL